MSKIILLDRDGVINRDSIHYIKSVDEFIFLPGSIEAIVRLNRAGYRIGVATNQSGVSRGLYNEQGLAAIHNKLLSDVREAGGEIEAIEYCTHLPEAGCCCRKPQPGMLKALATRLNCSSLDNVPFVGDRVSDIQAAFAAGATPMIVLSQMTDRIGLQDYPSVPVFNSLSECVDYLLAEHEPRH
ncbi:D-glycero-beta-D-manno-heptose 1,7-bisphosphate 7-phosphatase [Legionella jordanis]|uniref:D,D-heptose 1,7-bisphosphate phosphatase n=1 Tax=Legionella jordanis TaxID=456 RepID=A0A0W0V967_9GAMM|nr:D-glycero-beta-D-manno-heptose 1,7-bisphosphate 7-phosphatase [Legionella jordanis]KTD16686.1 D,D-heptose 1,7-bisphosphate phosphatase [Legionella jordanis]RMX03782.1 D-glycero-beta-D-manno-heptose 1,7-bisphosphate 7-phosphatase [Legionella jordanis]RMX22157.1 D-glycero-beta-D-manno-heptose 1,7-bisphosphate 7-phosphatase [Legionella jordanis]VEH11846.1 D,D-heptose 1,7-bisphosphate phosphatase [Legionella jordanis]HAT8712845.1 D-glycero-beta-D-manno-heptose 1,7-bisphosphate 7-phosphatase [Le